MTKLQSLTAMGLLSEPPPKSKTRLADLFKDGGGTADDVVKCETIVLGDNRSCVQPIDVMPSAINDEAVKLADEQQNDDTLVEAFKAAKENRNGYFVYKELLYHKNKISGSEVSQLVVPKQRREQVFTLAHSTGCSGHLRAYKTTLRIKMSYF